METREHVMSLIMPVQAENFSNTPALVIRHNINYDSFFEDFELLPVSEMTLTQLIHLKILYAMADFLYQQKVIDKYCQRLLHNEERNELAPAGQEGGSKERAEVYNCTLVGNFY